MSSPSSATTSSQFKGEIHAIEHANTAETRGHLSTTSLVLLIIAAAAPLTVVAGGVPTNFAVSNMLGVPLGYLALGLILILFSVGYGIMSTKIRNSGAFYAYVSEGLGNHAGLAAAILALVSYNLMQIGLYGIFGFGLSNVIETWTGADVPWWFAAIIGWVLVGILGINNIDLSAKFLGILVVLEFLVVAVVVFLALTNPVEGITTETIKLNQFFAPGMGVLLAFGIAAFMGFESAAIYSEETEEPEKTVPRATYIAVTVIAIFYAFSTWAFAQGIGPSQIINKSIELGPDLMFDWLAGYSVVGADVANVLFVFSSLAALIAFHNAAARYFFSLGRVKLFPSILSHTGKNGAPLVGSLVQSGLAITVVFAFGVAGTGSELGDLFPVLTIFTWLNMGAAVGLVFLLVLTGISIIVWLNRNKEEHNLFVRVIAPVLSTIGLLAVFILVLVNFELMIGDTGPRALVWVIPGFVILSGVLGILYGEFLRQTDPEAYEELRDVSYD